VSVLPVNVVIGKYRIEKRVGSGGMGEVYRATNLQTNSPVAIKALTKSGEGDTDLARFRNEAVIQYNLHHPNVAELYEYFEYQGKPCIVMEFVEGRTLDEWIREAGALEAGKALEILADICDAVSYMHSKGTIHRDIKSENIRVNAQGKAKLLDFGISISKATPALTRAGYTIGTPEKMAPEQHQGLRGDARSDVWAMGILLYEMLTGVPPFTNRNPDGLRQDILAVRYIAASKRKPGLPRALARIISNCLRAKPDERYASAGLMLRDVQQLRRRLHGTAWKRPFSANPAIAVGLGLVALMLLFYGLVSSRNDTPAAPTAHGSATGEAARTVEGFPSSATALPSRDAPRPERARPPSGAAGQPVPPVAAAGEPDLALSGLAKESRTITVTTYDGMADVSATKDGKPIGQTPYALTGPLGRNYEVWLRRPGFQARRVDVQINTNKTEYLFGLERDEIRHDFGDKD
jgi:predicted Ser/Thr protein kinase